MVDKERKMDRVSVSSSNILSIGYEENGMVLEVEFQSGDVYQYFDVPHEIYEGFLNAGSHGQYFWAYIRDRFPFEKG